MQIRREDLVKSPPKMLCGSGTELYQEWILLAVIALVYRKYVHLQFDDKFNCRIYFTFKTIESSFYIGYAYSNSQVKLAEQI